MMQTDCKSDTLWHVQNIFSHTHTKSHKTAPCKTLIIVLSIVNDDVQHQYQLPSCLSGSSARPKQILLLVKKINGCMQRHLEKHADDGHHCKSSVGKFR